MPRAAARGLVSIGSGMKQLPKRRALFQQAAAAPRARSFDIVSASGGGAEMMT
jgi:hypothetical protein